MCEIAKVIVGGYAAGWFFRSGRCDLSVGGRGEVVWNVWRKRGAWKKRYFGMDKCLESF